MHTALVITLMFVAATSALGAERNFRLSAATRQWAYQLGTVVGVTMALWCAYLSYWVAIN